MPTALFLSPHLDDAVFSCGALAARLADDGWETVLATAFTRSVVPATGFALACQLDKGLGPEIDYMALRRAEDLVAAELLGFDEVLWLNLSEAPHRGYENAAALFGAVLPGDDPGLRDPLAHLKARYTPDLVLAPQGLGGHVDHRVMIAAVLDTFPLDRMLFYRDTPYAIREPGAAPGDGIAGLPSRTIPAGGAMERKIAAAQAYASQIGFQFQGPANAAAALRGFAVQEGGGEAAERFLGRGLPPSSWPPHALRQP